MTSYVVDPERSRLTVLARPRLEAHPGADVRSVTGTLEVESGVVRGGSITVTLDGEPTRSAVIDLAGTGSQLTEGPDGETVLLGRADRPAGAFGLAGSPLLNPTLQLRWRLVLRESRPS